MLSMLQFGHQCETRALQLSANQLPAYTLVFIECTGTYQDDGANLHNSHDYSNLKLLIWNKVYPEVVKLIDLNWIGIKYTEN